MRRQGIIPTGAISDETRDFFLRQERQIANDYPIELVPVAYPRHPLLKSPGRTLDRPETNQGGQ